MNPPQAETDASAPSDGSSPWATDRTAPRSNTLAGSVYKSFTSPSLLRVLMHTTQPMFTGTQRSERGPLRESFDRISVAGRRLDTSYSTSLSSNLPEKLQPLHLQQLCG